MDFPKMYKVCQTIDTPQIHDIDHCIEDELSRLGLETKIKPNDRIAITAGSRGIQNIDQITGQVINRLRKYGAQPFIVPAMGSHGNGKASGQVEILKSLNITEESMNAPIVASMDVVQIGVSSHGFPVLVDKAAAGADHVVVINRVKPHTEFEGPVESGLMKMMAIGLGKHKGCEQVHRQTVNFGYNSVIPEIGRIILDKLPVLFGLGIVENLYDETAEIKACLPSEFYQTESDLLSRAKTYMARLPFDDVDVLIVDEIGKNISGTGMDTNVIGRIMFIGEPEPDSPRITRIVVLGVTPQSHGNGIGIGLADITTRQVLKGLNPSAMATNALAAMTPEKARIPIGLENDRAAVGAALGTIGAVRPSESRIIHIKNTLEMGILYISESLKQDMAGREDLKVLESLGSLAFDADGRIQPVLF